MKPDAEQSPEFDRFTNLVDNILSVPKVEVDKRLSEESKMRVLRYVREDIEADERRRSQIIPTE